MNFQLQRGENNPFLRVTVRICVLILHKTTQFLESVEFQRRSPARKLILFSAHEYTKQSIAFQKETILRGKMHIKVEINNSV